MSLAISIYYVNNALDPLDWFMVRIYIISLCPSEPPTKHHQKFRLDQKPGFRLGRPCHAHPPSPFAILLRDMAKLLWKCSTDTFQRGEGWRMQVGMDSNMAFFFFSSSSSLCFEKGYEMLGTCFVVGLYVTLGSLTLMRDFVKPQSETWTHASRITVNKQMWNIF